jgi:hypothetical protein
MYVIIRDDGQYVRPSGSPMMYSKLLQEAKVYKSRDEAERDRCVENERVVPLAECFRP